MALSEVLMCLTAVGLTAAGPIWCRGCPEDMKRDVWVSRGWGASGLPFGYVEQGARPGPPRAQAEEGERSGGLEPSAQFLTARLVSENERYSAVPQLFVSYGWGPLGK